MTAVAERSHADILPDPPMAPRFQEPGHHDLVLIVQTVSTLEDQSQIHQEQHEMHRALHHVGSPARERDDAYDEG
jgi:hypothetical protein